MDVINEKTINIISNIDDCKQLFWCVKNPVQTLTRIVEMTQNAIVDMEVVKADGYSNSVEDGLSGELLKGYNEFLKSVESFKKAFMIANARRTVKIVKRDK